MTQAKKPRSDTPLTLGEIQRVLGDTFLDKDKARGVEATFLYFVSEVGELAEAMRDKKKRDLEKEFADVLAWLISVANLKGVSMEDVMRKHYLCCPNCGRIPCQCVSKP
ncbi:MAG: MazG nucleotide pyrophosphohydrolase domain-containing protein [Candidatus Brocadiia bacterium]